MKESVFIFLFLTLFITTFKESNGQVGNAGVKVVLTQQGLDYAASQAVEIMAKKVPNVAIDDIAGQTRVAIGSVDYEISNTRITSFNKPSSNVGINQGQGLTLSLNGASMSASGNWRYRYKISFIKIRDSGSFSASADGISISVSVALGRNDRGAPTVSATGCSASIGEVNFKLHGGASWLYNIFLKFYKNKIRSSLESLMCKEAQEAINNNGATQLATLNLNARINDDLTLNYFLAVSPIFAENYMECNHVGRFLNDDRIENAPAMQATTDRMVSVSISDVTLNSASRVLFKNNKLRYAKDIPRDDLVAILSNILDRVDNPNPHARLRISVGASSDPVVSIQPGKITVNAEVEGTFDAVLQDNSTINLLTIKLVIVYEMAAGLSGDRVIGSVINFIPTLTYSSIPNADIQQINEGISQVTSLILPSINDALQHGIPLPNLSKIGFYDGVIRLNSRHITVAANFVYQP